MLCSPKEATLRRGRYSSQLHHASHPTWIGHRVGTAPAHAGNIAFAALHQLVSNHTNPSHQSPGLSRHPPPTDRPASAPPTAPPSKTRPLTYHPPQQQDIHSHSPARESLRDGASSCTGQIRARKLGTHWPAPHLPSHVTSARSYEPRPSPLPATLRGGGAVSETTSSGSPACAACTR